MLSQTSRHSRRARSSNVSPWSSSGWWKGIRSGSAGTSKGTRRATLTTPTSNTRITTRTGWPGQAGVGLRRLDRQGLVERSVLAGTCDHARISNGTEPAGENLPHVFRDDFIGDVERVQVNDFAAHGASLSATLGVFGRARLPPSRGRRVPPFKHGSAGASPSRVACGIKHGSAGAAPSQVVDFDVKPKSLAAPGRVRRRSSGRRVPGTSPISRFGSMPKRCSIVACRSCTLTTFSTAA